MSPSTTLIQADLPPWPISAPVLQALIEAILDRVGGVADPAQTTATLLADAGQALRQDTAAISPDPAGRLSARFTISDQPRSLGIELVGLWQREIALPESQETSVSDTQASGLGLGLFLTRQLMDEVDYRPEPAGNRWRLVKRLTPSSHPPQRVQLDLPAGYRYLNVLGAAIEALLGHIEQDSDGSVSQDVQLAAQETCTNIVDHAYARAAGRIQITLSIDPQAGRVVVDTLDRGSHTFDLAAVPDPFELSPSPRGGLLSSSALLFASTTIVNGGNYLFNLILGRWLGPEAFADLSLVITLLLMVGFVAIGFQQTAAKFSAMHAAAGRLEELAGLRGWLRRWAWVAGLALLAILALGAPLWQRFFHTASPWPFVILALGLPLYLVQGVDRGILQGQTRFGLLSASYQAEMWVRLLGAVALVSIGWAVNGAVGAVSLSLLATWLVAGRSARGLPTAGQFSREARRAVLLFAGPVVVAEVSQILINNSDILIVKHFFDAEAAGQYAALALIGRMVFFATWSVVIVMFPIVAQRQQRGEAHRQLLALSLGLVGLVSVLIIGATLLVPELIVDILFGQAYLAIAPLLWLYAVATALYALANVVVNYRLSLGNGRGTVLAVVAGVAQVVGLWVFHASLRQVVAVQIGIMAVLLVSLVAWDLSLERKRGK